MKTSTSTAVEVFFTSISYTASRVFIAVALLISTWILPIQAAELQTIPEKISGVVTKMTPVRHSSRWKTLNLTIGLPLRDRAGLTNLLQQLYDPASTNYHHFLTPEQFAERFGPTETGLSGRRQLCAGPRPEGDRQTFQPDTGQREGNGGGRGAGLSCHHQRVSAPHRNPGRFMRRIAEPSIDLAVPVLGSAGWIIMSFRIPA